MNASRGPAAVLSPSPYLWAAADGLGLVADPHSGEGGGEVPYRAETPVVKALR